MQHLGLIKCKVDTLHSKDGIQARTPSTVFDSAGVRDRVQHHGLGAFNSVDSLVPFRQDLLAWSGCAIVLWKCTQHYPLTYFGIGVVDSKLFHIFSRVINGISHLSDYRRK
jgi:hypothetical protein